MQIAGAQAINRRCEQAYRHRDAANRTEDIDPTLCPSDPDRYIGGAARYKLIPSVCPQQLLANFNKTRAGEGFTDRHELALDPNNEWRPGFQM